MPRLLPDFTPTSPPAGRRRWVIAGVAIAVSGVLPLAAFAAASKNGRLLPATVGATSMPVPANVDLNLAATVSGRRVALRWHDGSHAGGPVFFRVWRGRSDGFTCPPNSGGRLCVVTLPEIGTTHDARFIDHPPSGRWVYRVAVAANWLNDVGYGDAYVVSPPLAVHVP